MATVCPPNREERSTRMTGRIFKRVYSLFCLVRQISESSYAMLISSPPSPGGGTDVDPPSEDVVFDESCSHKDNATVLPPSKPDGADAEDGEEFFFSE